MQPLLWKLILWCFSMYISVCVCVCVWGYVFHFLDSIRARKCSSQWSPHATLTFHTHPFESMYEWSKLSRGTHTPATWYFWPSGDIKRRQRTKRIFGTQNRYSTYHRRDSAAQPLYSYVPYERLISMWPHWFYIRLWYSRYMWTAKHIWLWYDMRINTIISICVT